MAVLEDGDFEIEGLVLKGTDDYPIYVQQFDPGKVDVLDQDAINPLDGSIVMGRDRVVPSNWEFKLGMGDFTPGPALAALGSIQRVWNVAERTPGAETALKYKVGGRVRQVFGRPRPFSFNPEMLVNVGYVVAVAGFHRNDALHYGVDLKTLELDSQIQPRGGGFEVPFLAPIMTDPGQSKNGFATNLGSAAAPFKLRIMGPVTNPKVTGPGWNIALDYSIPEGQWADVDTKTRTVKLRSGANISGRLKRTSRLLSARLAPGRNAITFAGTDPTGLSRIRLQWYDAYTEH